MCVTGHWASCLCLYRGIGVPFGIYVPLPSGRPEVAPKAIGTLTGLSYRLLGRVSQPDILVCGPFIESLPLPLNYPLLDFC